MVNITPIKIKIGAVPLGRVVEMGMDLINVGHIRRSYHGAGSPKSFQYVLLDIGVLSSFFFFFDKVHLGTYLWI